MRGLIFLSLLAGTAAPAAASTIIVEERGLSDYVQGRYAAATGELEQAADLYEGALGYAPEDPYLLKRTFDLAVEAGDEKLAVGVARRLVDEAPFDSAVAMLLTADALQRKDWDDLNSRLDGLASSGFGSLVAPIARAWALEARSKEKDARAALAGASPEGLAESYWVEHRGHVALATGKEEEAIAAYQPLIEGDEGANVRIRLALAEALQKDGQDAEAKVVLDAALDHPDVLAARKLLADGKKLRFAPQDAREGVATMLLRIAADLSNQRTVPIALTFARIATWLAPDNSTAWLMTSQLLARSEELAPALAAARQIDDEDPSAGMARGQEAALLSGLDRKPEALQMLELAASAPGATARDHMLLGDAYQDADRFDDALVAYRTAQTMPIESDDVRWQLFFLIGAAEEQRGDWQAAEVALRQALAIAPDEAITLNYLGYTLLDRGMKMDEAVAMIEEAHRLEPNDGHITDSLGWAQYRVGDYEKAVATLEEAIRSVPGDATINDHLGDAYWQVGRRIEARFRWQAALEGEPSDKQIAAINAKLRYGYERGVALAQADGEPRL
ncbi:tetratricopeptide repeat protein [Pacificimonas sp. ICDLI1SI03]